MHLASKQPYSTFVPGRSDTITTHLMAVLCHYLTHFLLTTLLLVYANSPCAATLNYKIHGLNWAQKINVELFLQTLPDIESSALPDFQDDVIKSVTQAMSALGYYQPDVQLELKNGHSKKPLLHITVTAGRPVVYRTVTITVTGDAEHHPAFTELLKNVPLTPGKTLNHGDYDGVKSSITTLGQGMGFFDGVLRQHSVAVFPDEHAADVTLVYDSKKRYAFGDIRYPSVSDAMRDIISTMVDFKLGNPYSAAQLVALNNALSSTKYFLNVTILPLKDEATHHQVPIQISVTPNRQHAVAVGLGFSTNEGPRASLTWDKPLIGTKGHSLSQKLMVSQKRTEVTSNYKIPGGNPLLSFYDLQAGYRYKDVEDTQSHLTTLAIHRWTKNPDTWDRDVFLRSQHERYRQGSEHNTSLLLIPGFSLSKRQANHSLDPSRGHLMMVTVEGSDQALGSDASFLKVWGRSKWLTTLTPHHRLITRAGLGAIWIDDIYSIPPAVRFFTGGDQTVRGYAYESISPKDRQNELIGGQYTGALSIEHNYQFAEHWRTALFIDSGIATNDLNDAWKTGLGLGLRWLSPIGPVGLDLAFAISEDGSPWRIHFSIGPDL